jgi:hypothetical protein
MALIQVTDIGLNGDRTDGFGALLVGHLGSGLDSSRGGGDDFVENFLSLGRVGLVVDDDVVSILDKA